MILLLQSEKCYVCFLGGVPVDYLNSSFFLI